MATLPDVRPAGDLGPPPALALAQPRLHAEPGAAAQTAITVRHAGTRVESYRLDVVGLEPGWWQVHPPELELFPGTSGEAVVELRPPAGAHAPESALPFGVRAVSTLDPSRSVVEEGDLEVGRVLELKGEIVPVTSRARWTGRHTVRFTNWGNTSVQLKLRGEDKDTRLAFLVEPAELTVPVGGTGSARVRARVRRPVLRGTATRLPFRIVADQPGAPVPRGPMGLPDPARPVLDAAVDQRPVLTRGVMVVLTLALMAVLAAVALLLRAPSVQGATQLDKALPAPTRVESGGFVGKGLLVSWTGAAEGASHQVALLRAPEGTPPADGDPQDWKDVERGARSFTYEVPELAPDREYCVVVATFRSGMRGTEGDPVCATSPADELPAPEGVAVEAAPEGRARVVWKQEEDVTYRVLSVDPVSGAPGAALTDYASAALATVDAAGSGRCFVVQAQKDSAVSPASSPPQCLPAGAPVPTDGSGPDPSSPATGNTGEPSTGTATTPASPGSPTGGATTSGTAGWVTVMAVHPLVQGVEEAKRLADRTKAGLDKARIPAFVVRSDQAAFPALSRLYPSSYVTFVRAASQEAAANLCETAPARTRESYPTCEPVDLGAAP